RQWQSMVRTDALPDEVALTHAGVDLLLATRSLSSIEQTWITPVDRDGNVGASTWVDDAIEMQLAASSVSVAAAWRTSSGFAVAQLDGTGHVLGHPTTVATLDPSVATQQRVLVSIADRVLFGSVRATRTQLEFVHLNDPGI